jgi:hypothetical protein
MSDWTYKRGRWTASPWPGREEDQEKLQLWNWLQRWEKFPQLGPPPARWMKYGGVPPFHVQVGVLLKAFYGEPVREMFNNTSPLLQFIGRGR